MWSDGRARGMLVVGLFLAAAPLLVACAHVKPEELDDRLAQMQAQIRQEREQELSQVDTRISELEGSMGTLRGRMDAVEQELRRLAQELDATVERLETSLRFTTPVHFGFDEAELLPEHRGILDRFARVVREYYPGYLVTVEGFADPVGSAEYNRDLGLRRAQAVMEYLTGTAGLTSERVRAVSYGEAQDRLVAPSEHGPGMEGRENRRVVLVVDFVQG